MRKYYIDIISAQALKSLVHTLNDTANPSISNFDETKLRVRAYCLRDKPLSLGPFRP
jgi:hypothetical protein